LKAGLIHARKSLALNDSFCDIYSMNNTKRIILFLLAGAVFSPAAFGHNYLRSAAGSDPTVIPDISVSRAAYRELTSASQVDLYEFTAKKGQELFIQMTVPLLDRLKDFAPAFVLVSTGDGQQEFPTAKVEQGTVIEAPHDVVDRVHAHAGGDGAEPPLLALQYAAETPVVFNEPFTGTRYWIRQTLTVNAPADGTYRIGVYSPNGSTGKYVLAPGKKERFGLGDLFTFPSVRMSVRAFCEQPIWPDIVVWSVLGAAVATWIGLGVFALAVL
jgi:hypothetical protein